MIRFWPWRRTSRSVRPVQSSPQARVDVDIPQPYGPWWSVSVMNDAVEPGGDDRLIAMRAFSDPDEAARVQTAWHRHRPDLEVILRETIRSSFEPSYTGFYFDADGTQHEGQPPEVNTLIAEEAAAAQERAAGLATANDTKIMETSGMAEPIANSNVDKVGLTGQQPTAQEEAPVTTATTPRFFPHHPHFVSVETVQRFGQTGENYTFRRFTGDEPEPTHPDWPSPHKSVEEQTEDEKAMWAEFSERNREIDAAIRCWEEARYHRGVTPLVKAACKARPPVDEALAEMDAAWKGLDDAKVWPVAVKRVLNAHENARKAMTTWVYEYAEPLAVFEGRQSYYIREHVSNWRGIAEKLGYRTPWGIGTYWKGDSYSHASYDDSPIDDVALTIRTQRAELEEIARFIKPDTSADD